MAFSTIDKSSSFMNPVLYTGDGNTSNAITGVGFQPDLVWLKDRDQASNHQLQDAVRGKSGSNYYSIHSDSTAAQSVQGDDDGLNTLGADGFTVGYTNSTAWNESGTDYVSWNWKAGTTTGIAGSPSITPASYSFNATSGFSIIKYVGTGANATLPHGLGVAPKMIIIKELDNTGSWVTYHEGVGNTKAVFIDTTQVPAVDSTYWQDTTPTSTLFSLGSNGNLNQSTVNYIAYCFADVAGYSKFSSYEGNGNNDGTFVYTGFKPSFVMIKNMDSASTDWYIYDSKRGGPVAGVFGNPNKYFLQANTTAVEGNETFDMYSNGFKPRITNNFLNSGTLIYMAFGQPIISNGGVCATAR